MPAQKITIEGFLDEFKQRHEQMADRPFCWVLGSGASIQSGIPSGKELALQWLSELHKREDFNRLAIEEWATADNLGIPGFAYPSAANFYPWIYQRRFRDYKEQGYAFLEKTMDHAEPSFGYSVLAQIMATTAHKVAVTTNFDNLVADALSIYTRVFPLVCGHESLTGYIRPNLRRPLIAKIHRDLLLAPLSNPDEIDELPIEWSAALTKIFDRFTPIVLGYGGNDGSLMGLLKKIPSIEGTIFWCYRESTEIEQKIQDVVERHHGRLVPITGFDEVMLQLQEKLALPFLLPQLQGVHDKRVSDYQEQFTALTERLRKPAEDPVAEEARKPVRRAAEAAVERLTKEKTWWAWQLKANAEANLDKREAIYREGIEDFPTSYDLVTYFAMFMENVRKDYDEAERLFRLALELDANHASNPANLAHFLYRVRKSYDEAERLFRMALGLDSNQPSITGNFAAFMYQVRKEYDEAERLFRKALELDPNQAASNANFALFMYQVRKDYDEAERLYRKSLERDPNNSVVNGTFAVFLHLVRKDHNEAEQRYRKAVELAPHDGRIIGYFAQFLGARDRLSEAQELSIRAWELLDELPERERDHARLAFTRWLLDRATGGQETPALGRLKTILQMGFLRTVWSFEELLTTLLPYLAQDEQALARKLADAILDEGKLNALDDEPVWKAIEPIPLDTPWPK